MHFIVWKFYTKKLNKYGTLKNNILKYLGGHVLMYVIYSKMLQNVSWVEDRRLERLIDVIQQIW